MTHTNKLVMLAVATAFATGCTTMNQTNPVTGLATTDRVGAGVNTPPSAKPGECYVNLHNKPVTEETSQQVLATAASSTLEVIPATYETVEERVMLKPATTRLEVIPAVYETVTERVMVKPETKKLVPVDAVYEEQSEQVLVAPASTFWKRSTVAEAAASGATEQIVGDDGYVMCLIEKPAEYKTVTSTVMVKGPSTREEIIPAEYATIEKTVLKTPATTSEVEVPAEYGTVQKTQLVSPASEKVTEIPATYDTVTSTKVVSEGSWEWRQILCGTNSTPEKISSIESALAAAGHNPGNVDGVVDGNTLTAIREYQSSKGLPLDRGRYINVETVKSLGITPN
ncbi:MAG: peptidoglycan-binding protein [Methylophilaceae bacterium]